MSPAHPIVNCPYVAPIIGRPNPQSTNLLLAVGLPLLTKRKASSHTHTAGVSRLASRKQQRASYSRTTIPRTPGERHQPRNRFECQPRPGPTRGHVAARSIGCQGSPQRNCVEEDIPDSSCAANPQCISNQSLRASREAWTRVPERLLLPSLRRKRRHRRGGEGQRGRD